MLCKGMLFTNVVWDFLSVLCIWVVFCSKDVLDDIESDLPIGSLTSEIVEPDTIYKKIAYMHTSMWSRQVDANNKAACMLMAWWVLTLGTLRLLVLYNEEWMVLAVLSYGLEGCAFCVESLKSTMVPKKACPASLFSFICLFLCVLCI